VNASEWFHLDSLVGWLLLSASDELLARLEVTAVTTGCLRLVFWVSFATNAFGASEHIRN